MKWVCEVCGREIREDAAAASRCECGGLIEIAHDAKRWDAEALKRLFHDRLQDRTSVYASGVWRYKELIHPLLPESAIVTRGEGNTGLYRASSALEAYAGVRELRFKAQSENPSGSFKDCGMVAAVSEGRRQGFSRFACASTGNTSSSLAMYASRAGCRAYVFLPVRGISPNKVLQTWALGGRVLAFEGTYDDGIRFLEAHGRSLGLYVCNSVNPFRIEGQKSMVFELAQTLDWSLPDWIVVPGGALSNAAAIGKAVCELHDSGFIARKPRIAIVQAEGASPFSRMIEAGGSELIPEPKPLTRASALNIGNPPGWRKAWRYAIQGAQGTALSVTDGEIMEAKRLIDTSGIGCEPASAAALAGLKKLRERGVVSRDESAVCVLTGHLLKDTDILMEWAGWLPPEAASASPGERLRGSADTDRFRRVELDPNVIAAAMND